ncbi:MAG: hypothetical protein M0Z55_05710 [Peptococcaceae bacterium]|nr:hypothetical protein [Peptococcaceae bacterium]
MVKISKPTLWTKTNRESILGALVVGFVLLALLCSVVIAGLTVNVANITASNDFHYVVQANGKSYNLVPSDILRVDRSSTKQGFAGQQIDMLKIYTTHGFIFASTKDSYYQAALKMVNSVDFYGLQTYVQPGVTLDEVQDESYAIGTSVTARSVVFALIGIQNLIVVAVAFTLLILIFPLRPEKEQESARVISRMEQPA